MLEEAKQAEPITQPKSKVWYGHPKLSKNRSPSIFSDVHHIFCIYTHLLGIQEVKKYVNGQA